MVCNKKYSGRFDTTIYEKEVIKMSKLKTVLITGNNGFIGSYFVKKYNKKYNIIGLDKEEAFDKLQLIMTEAGELDKKAPYNKIINNKYAEECSK